MLNLFNILFNHIFNPNELSESPIIINKKTPSKLLLYFDIHNKI